jgi:hypothetical protein
MTSVAMIAGMLPVALGVAGGAAFQSQMAIAVIGGLVTSTGLTLVLVPAAFTWIDDFERWIGRKVGHHLVNDDSPSPAPPGATPGMASGATAPGGALPSTGAAT